MHIDAVMRGLLRFPTEPAHFTATTSTMSYMLGVQPSLLEFAGKQDDVQVVYVAEWFRPHNLAHTPISFSDFMRFGSEGQVQWISGRL
jgi:hypothetical protein